MFQFICGVCGALSVSFVVGLSVFIYKNAFYEEGKKDKK
jgi:hypothetical protein